MKCCSRMTKFAFSDILHSYCSNTVNISTVIMLGFSLCQFNTVTLACGLCLSLMIKFLFPCSILTYVLKVTISEVLWFEFRWVLFVPF